MNTYWVVEFDEVSSVAALMMHIFHLPLRPSDAVVVFTGLGEHHRVSHGLSLRRCGWAEYLLVAGMNQQQNQQFGAYTEEWLAQYLGQSEKAKVFVLEEAPTIIDQANWALDIAKEHSFTSLIITASFYHLPRAFLTLLKAMLKRGERLNLVPASSEPTLPNEYRLIPGEVRRIIGYQKSGDVATFSELLAYLKEDVA